MFVEFFFLKLCLTEEEWRVSGVFVNTNVGLWSINGDNVVLVVIIYIKELLFALNYGSY